MISNLMSAISLFLGLREWVGTKSKIQMMQLSKEEKGAWFYQIPNMR